MECRPTKQVRRHITTKRMDRFQRRLLAGAHCRFLLKKLRDKLLLGSLSLLDKSLGAVYFILDAGFEGLEASKAKDIFLPHNLSSSSSPASSTSSSSSSSSTPRSSNDFGAEDKSLLPAFNSNVNQHDLERLSTYLSPAPGGNQENVSKPRRAGIIADRNNAKNCSEGFSCTCWGWQVDEEPLDDEQIPMDDVLQELPLHDDDDEYSNGQEVKVRWSECQCSDCRKLWMPMSKARSRLHVQKWNASNNNSDVELNRKARKSPDKFVGGTSKDQPAREPKLDGANLQSFGKSKSSGTVDGVARHWDRKSSIGAKSFRRVCAHSVGRSFTDQRQRETTGVIFLHGLFSSSDFWFDSNIVPMLDDEIKARHVILAPDLLGCGRSPRPHDSVYTLSDQVDALENSLLRSHSLESYHIVAHSMGTVPALAFAARYPHRVRSLTLIAPVYAGYTDPKRGGEEILTDCNAILSFQDPWSMRAIRSLTASEYYNINRCFGHLLFSRHRFLVPIFQRLLQNRWPRSFIRDYLAVTHDAAWHIVHNTMIGGSHAVVPALRKLKARAMRVLVVHGTEDTSCPFKKSELMTQHFENVVLASVPGKGHVDVILGRDDELLPLLEEEIRLGDRNFSTKYSH